MLVLVRRITLIALIAFASSAFAEPTNKYAGNRTDVDLSDDFLSALTSLEVTPAPVKGSKLRGAQIRFPIPAAEIDLGTAQGEILHTGGLRLSKDDTVVELTLFIIDLTDLSAPVLTGLAKVNGSVVGRIPLFNLSLPALSLPLPSTRTLTVPNVGVNLHPTAASTLNSVFGVSAFTDGFGVGVAHVILRRTRN